ncbi:MAG TPA: ABC transporter ATP-binding protein [Candidatus Paceibacterota bacterium]
MQKEILLKLDNVSVHYGGVKALDGASVQIDEGEVIALMGPNGAGKSTVLKALFGIAPIESGRVVWREKAIKPLSHEMVERGVAFVPQGRRVFKHLTVRENLEVGGYSVKDTKLVAKRVDEVLELFPVLKQKIKAKSGTLSGGQQQMLAIARGLMIDPKVLLLDEPTLGLAPKVVLEVFAKIKEINERRGIAVVVVEHNLKSLMAIASRAYVMDKGKVAFSGSAKEVVDSDILKKIFTR